MKRYSQHAEAATDLDIARKLLKEPNRWCQRAFYSNDSLCALSALEAALKQRGVTLKFFSDIQEYPAYKHLLITALQLYGTDPMTVNDGMGYDAVIRMFNVAWNRAKSRQKIDIEAAWKQRKIVNGARFQDTSSMSAETP